MRESSEVKGFILKYHNSISWNTANINLIPTVQLISKNLYLSLWWFKKKKRFFLTDGSICSNNHSTFPVDPPHPHPSHDGRLYFHFTALWTHSACAQVASIPHPSMPRWQVFFHSSSLSCWKSKPRFTAKDTSITATVLVSALVHEATSRYTVAPRAFLPLNLFIVSWRHQSSAFWLLPVGCYLLLIVSVLLRLLFVQTVISSLCHSHTIWNKCANHQKYKIEPTQVYWDIRTFGTA